MKNDPYIVTTYLQAKEREKWVADGTSPIVTISRQVGADGEVIARRTSEILTVMSQGAHPWVVVDKDIAERVVEDHHLPKRIQRFFTEEEVLTIDDHVEGILGLSEPGSTMIEKMTRTVVHLARMGHVILVGRAGYLITAQFPRAVHVRVIGSFDRRVERLTLERNLSWDAAAAKVKEVDEQRRHFVETYYRSDPTEQTHYDMIFNTDRVSAEESARLIAHLVSSPDFRDKQAQKLVELRHQVLG